MRLVNQTGIAAAVTTSDIEGSPHRIGLLTAKATFRFDDRGCIQLDTQGPFPLFAQDQPTPVGDLPADLEARADSAFEVILLGHAYAPHGHPVCSLTVALTVGGVRRQMLVIGDRSWSPNRKTCSRPIPFAEMPLTWHRAFGGTVPINLDRDSVFDLADPWNRHGKGFDAEGMARGLGDLLKAPAGYPRLPSGHVRSLPNLEDPSAPITRWEDTPRPLCWATVPRDVLPGAVGQTGRHEGALPEDVGSGMPRTVGYRAHPAWVMASPAQAPRLRLENLVANSASLELTLPDIGVVADYTVNGRIASRRLRPHTLVLLPDQGCFTVLFRLPFSFRFEPGDERELRLRREPRWFSEEA